MLIILSPSKTLNFDNQLITDKSTIPVFTKETQQLVKILSKLNPDYLGKLMDISPKLAMLSFERFQNWNHKNSVLKQSILAFDGDVYDGLNAANLSENELLGAQNSIRILSGLYGVLKPLDLIQPHRLEMGTHLKINRHKDLYSFWKTRITAEIALALKEKPWKTVINLASVEYSKSIDFNKLKAEIISPEFKDMKDGSYKIISFYAKRARGLMARFIIDNQISQADDLKAFNSDGYNFTPRLSGGKNLVFTREPW